MKSCASELCLEISMTRVCPDWASDCVRYVKYPQAKHLYILLRYIVYYFCVA
jgi:hypothetical protein